MNTHIELVHFVRSYLYNKVYSNDDKFKELVDGLNAIPFVSDARFMYNPPSYCIEIDSAQDVNEVERVIKETFNQLLRNTLFADMDSLKEECRRILDRNLGFKTDHLLDAFVYTVLDNTHLLYTIVVLKDSPLKNYITVWLTV